MYVLMFLRLQTAPNQQLRGIYNAMFVDFVFLTLLEPMLAPCEHIRTEERSLRRECTSSVHGEYSAFTAAIRCQLVQVVDDPLLCCL